MTEWHETHAAQSLIRRKPAAEYEARKRDYPNCPTVRFWDRMFFEQEKNLRKVV